MNDPNSRTPQAGQTRETLHALARGYAALGWPVFPLAAGQKIPQYRNPHPFGSRERSACPGRFMPGGCGRDGHGVKDATVSAAVVDTWWTVNPRANIGISCGVTGAGSGPDVVDFDVKDGAPGATTFQRLRDIGLLAGSFATVTTPSGGWHLYYDGSAQGNGSIKGFGVDFRSAGGYVVAPGCPVGLGGGRAAVVSPGGHPLPLATQSDPWAHTYRWAWGPVFPDRQADWLAIRHFLKPSPPPLEPAARHVLSGTGESLLRWYTTQGAGSENRNNGLFWAACMIIEHSYGEAALTELASIARSHGLDDHEIGKTIGSARLRATAGSADGR